MPFKSVAPMLLAGTIAVWLVSNPALAATRTAAIDVTATVEAGCQVSPSPSALDSRALTPSGSKAAVSVDCSLPADYQVVVGNSPRIMSAAFDSPGADLAAIPEVAQSRDPDLLQVWGGPFGADQNEEFEFGPQSPFSSISLTGPITAQQCVPYVADSETIIVTIIY